eukprot:94189-Amphidinium_carterae.1
MTSGPVSIGDDSHASTVGHGDVDSTFCTQAATAAVRDRYAADYEFLAALGLPYHMPHLCESSIS